VVIPGQGLGFKVKAPKTSGGGRTPVRHTIPLGIVIFLVRCATGWYVGLYCQYSTNPCEPGFNKCIDSGNCGVAINESAVNTFCSCARLTLTTYFIDRIIKLSIVKISLEPYCYTFKHKCFIWRFPPSISSK